MLFGTAGRKLNWTAGRGVGHGGSCLHNVTKPHRLRTHRDTGREQAIWRQRAGGRGERPQPTFKQQGVALAVITGTSCTPQVTPTCGAKEG